MKILSISLSLVSIIVALFTFNSCDSIDFEDLARFPSVTIITPVQVDLNRLTLVAQISNNDSIQINAVGFEILPNNGSISSIVKYPAQIEESYQFRVITDKQLALNTDYQVRAYLVLEADTIFSSKVPIRTSGITLSLVAVVRNNEAIITGNVSGIPDSCVVTEHGIIWSKNFIEGDTLNCDVNDGKINLHEKQGSGSFDQINFELESKVNYLIKPFIEFEGECTLGDSTLISLEWTFHDYDGEEQSPRRLMKAVGFTVEGVGYICTGRRKYEDESGTTIDEYTNALWRFDNNSLTWMEMKSFPGSPRIDAIAFAIDENGDGLNDKAYVGLGIDEEGNCLNDIYEFRSVEGWVPKADFPVKNSSAIAFAVGQYGYVGTGRDTCSSLSRLFYEFDPNDSSDGLDENGNPIGKWGKKAPLPGTSLSAKKADAIGFSIGNYGYLSNGIRLGQSFFADLNQFDPNDSLEINENNRPVGSWKILADPPVSGRAGASVFVINEQAYVGLGNDTRDDSRPIFKDFYVFNPKKTINPWREISDMGIELRDHAAAFVIGDKGYVYGGRIGDETFKFPTARLYVYSIFE